jgi:hypothetical protein
LIQYKHKLIVDRTGEAVKDIALRQLRITTTDAKELEHWWEDESRALRYFKFRARKWNAGILDEEKAVLEHIHNWFHRDPTRLEGVVSACVHVFGKTTNLKDLQAAVIEAYQKHMKGFTAEMAKVEWEQRWLPFITHKPSAKESAAAAAAAASAVPLQQGALMNRAVNAVQLDAKGDVDGDLSLLATLQPKVPTDAASLALIDRMVNGGAGEPVPVTGPNAAVINRAFGGIQIKAGGKITIHSNNNNNSNNKPS